MWLGWSCSSMRPSALIPSDSRPPQPRSRSVPNRFCNTARRKGYQLTRYADDWVITCASAAEARAAIADALRILEQLGVQLHPQKTRIVHVQQGFEFLGYKIKRGRRRAKPTPRSE